MQGTVIKIGVGNTNPTGYSLDRWTKDGVNYAGTADYFYYTVDGSHTFTAVYKQAAANCNWYISGPTIYLQAGQSGRAQSLSRRIHRQAPAAP